MVGPAQVVITASELDNIIKCWSLVIFDSLLSIIYLLDEWQVVIELCCVTCFQRASQTSVRQLCSIHFLTFQFFLSPNSSLSLVLLHTKTQTCTLKHAHT